MVDNAAPSVIEAKKISSVHNLSYTNLHLVLDRQESLPVICAENHSGCRVRKVQYEPKREITAGSFDFGPTGGMRRGTLCAPECSILRRNKQIKQ